MLSNWIRPAKIFCRRTAPFLRGTYLKNTPYLNYLEYCEDFLNEHVFMIRQMCPFFQHMSSVRNKAAYEGDGKTTIRIINQEQDLGLLIDSYATYGFRLNNGITVLGPMAIFPRTVLSWQVRGSEEITEQSLRLFKLLDPKIDLLVVGLEGNDRSAMTGVFRACRSAALNVEILPTEHACATFNFLNAEGRCVAGALIPPLVVDMNEDDMLRATLHYTDLYNKQLT